MLINYLWNQALVPGILLTTVLRCRHTYPQLLNTVMSPMTSMFIPSTLDTMRSSIAWYHIHNAYYIIIFINSFWKTHNASITSFEEHVFIKFENKNRQCDNEVLLKRRYYRRSFNTFLEYNYDRIEFYLNENTSHHPTPKANCSDWYIWELCVKMVIQYRKCNVQA